MPKSRKCICDKFKIIFHFARWTGVLPIIPSASTENPCKEGCQFEISKFSIFINICYQILLIPFFIWTIFSYCNVLSKSNNFMTHAQIAVIVSHAIEYSIILIIGIKNAKNMALIFYRLSRFPYNFNIIYKKIFSLVISELLLQFISLLLWLLATCYGIPFFNPNYILGCSLGYIYMIATITFEYAQNNILMLLCLLISSSFNNLADDAKKLLELQSKKRFKNDFITSTINVTNKTDETLNIEVLHSRFCEITSILNETNKSMGFQLLFSIWTNLFTTIHLIFRKLTGAKYHAGIFVESYSIIACISLIAVLILYCYFGHLIKTSGRKPIGILQNSQLLHFPLIQQQQLQTLLLQIMSFEPSYLIAYHIVYVGPWLLAPVFGSVVTYLLVFLQYDNT